MTIFKIIVTKVFSLVSRYNKCVYFGKTLIVLTLVAKTTLGSQFSCTVLDIKSCLRLNVMSAFFVIQKISIFVQKCN